MQSIIIFNKAKVKFKNLQKKHRTIGKRSNFSVVSKDDKLIITNSGKNVGEIDFAFFEKVFERYNKSDQKKHFASNYTDTKWKECPSRIFAPYVASIIKDLIE